MQCSLWRMLRAGKATLSLALLVITACGDDPSLEVKVHHEHPPIARTMITVYESGTATCAQIEFGDLDDVQLSALAVAEMTLTDAGTTGDLDNISRTERKLIVARGYSDTGELLEAGCVQHDEIIGADVAEVTTHPIALVSVQPSPNLPYQLGVLVTNRDGEALPARAVTYRMDGPVGSKPARTSAVTELADGTWQPEVPTCANDDGFATLHPVTPDTVGGFATTVRVAWGARLAQTFSGISNADFALEPLDVQATVHPCAVSVHGTTKRLVCVDRMLTKTVARQYQVELVDGRANLTGLQPPMELAGSPVALVALPGVSNASDREVYAVDVMGTLTPLFGASAAASCGTACLANVTDVLYAPACGTDGAQLVFKIWNTAIDDNVYLVPPRSGPATPVGDMNLGVGKVTLNNSGCVTTTTATGNETRQLTVLDLTSASGVTITRGVYSCTSSSCKHVNLPVPSAAAAFTRTSPPYLIGATNDASGVVLATWGLVVDPTGADGDRLVERAPRILSVTIPDRIAVGRFDSDLGSDMIWNVTLRGVLGSRFELAYSKPVGGGVLQALSQSQPFTAYDMFSTDVTGDDHDDIIIVSRGLVGSRSGVMVLPTQVSVASATVIPTDAPCAP